MKTLGPENLSYKVSDLNSHLVEGHKSNIAPMRPGGPGLEFLKQPLYLRGNPAVPGAWCPGWTFLSL